MGPETLTTQSNACRGQEYCSPGVLRYIQTCHSLQTPIDPIAYLKSTFNRESRGPEEDEILAEVSRCIGHQEGYEEGLQEGQKEILILIQQLIHDLRVPLTSVIAYCDLILLGGISVDERDIYLNRIKRNGNNINDVINMLFKLSTEQEHKPVPNIQQISEVFINQELIFAPDNTTHQLSVNIEEGLDDSCINYTVFLLALRQTFSNAIKYGTESKSGKPNISVKIGKLKKPDSDESYVVLQVTNASTSPLPDQFIEGLNMREIKNKNMDEILKTRSMGIGLKLLLYFCKRSGIILEASNDGVVNGVGGNPMFTFMFPVQN